MIEYIGMSIYWSIILGAIQGITEVLPISSSAHLVLFPWFFKVPDQGLAFDVALHIGSLLAIIIAFKKDWLKLVKETFYLIKSKLKPQNQSQRMIYYLAMASIPGALAGYFLEEEAESIFRSPYVIVFTLIFYGLLLIIFERIGKKIKKFENIGLKESSIIGLAQALAIIPGTSRSGVTISAGLMSGLTKEDAAKFSFMLSAPIILGAGIVKLPDIYTADAIGISFWLGLFSAFVFGLLAIKFILKFVQTKSFSWFAIYRFLLAGLIIIAIITR